MRNGCVMDWYYVKMISAANSLFYELVVPLFPQVIKMLDGNFFTIYIDNCL